MKKIGLTFQFYAHVFADFLKYQFPEHQDCKQWDIGI